MLDLVCRVEPQIRSGSWTTGCVAFITTRRWVGGVLLLCASAGLPRRTCRALGLATSGAHLWHNLHMSIVTVDLIILVQGFNIGALYY
jgi:hypothetical protein